MTDLAVPVGPMTSVCLLPLMSVASSAAWQMEAAVGTMRAEKSSRKFVFGPIL